MADGKEDFAYNPGYWQGITDRDLGWIRESLRSIQNDIRNIQTSVHQLENWKYQVMGISATLAAVIASTISAITAILW